MRVFLGRAHTPEGVKPLSVHQWGCSRCGREDTGPRKDTPEAARRLERNCDGETNRAFGVIGAPTLRACPWATLTPEDEQAVANWQRWDRLGVWPFPGGGADQPAPVLEEIEICDQTADERRAEHPAPTPPKKPRR
jgi:hypothetical protein